MSSHASPLFLYRGGISQSLFDCIIKISEKKLYSKEFRAPTRKKLFHIIVEMVQNVFNYYQKNPCQHYLEPQFFFAILREKDGYAVLTSNYISNKQKSYIRSKLDHINSMNNEDIRKTYRLQLRKGNIKEEGAGLGMIDMFRRSKNPIEFDFAEVDHRYSLFGIKVKVSA